MTNTPKVSILTSCYNHENFVEDLVRSVYGQQGVEFEFLVIDDGSSDRSVEVLKLLSLEYGFYFEAQENIGFTKTLNKLLGKAQGEYLIVIASDDVLAPDRLKLQVNFLDNNVSHALVCGDVVELDEAGRMGSKISYPFEEGELFSRLLRKELFILAPTVMVRKEVIIDLGGWDAELAIEDWDMWLRVSEKYSIGYLDQVFAFYRIHSGNSHGNYQKMYLEMERTLEKFQSNAEYPAAKVKLYADAASYLSGIKGYKGLAWTYLMKAMNLGSFKIVPKILFKLIFIRKA